MIESSQSRSRDLGINPTSISPKINKQIKDLIMVPFQKARLDKRIKRRIVKLIKKLLCSYDSLTYDQVQGAKKFFGYCKDLQQHCDKINERLFNYETRMKLYQKPFIRFNEQEAQFRNQITSAHYYYQIRKIKQKDFQGRIQLQKHQQNFMTPADLKSSDPQKILVDHSKSECFGCVRQMKEGSLYFKNNQYYSLLNCYSNEELLTQKLKQKFVMLLNKGGGFLFIVHEEDAHVKGFKMVDNYSDVYENFIRSRVSTWIFPSEFHYWVYRIQTEENQKKIILRITVVPIKQYINWTFFVSKKVDRSPTSFKLFVMDQTCKDHKQDILSLDYDQIYPRILQHFYRIKSQNQFLRNQLSSQYPIKQGKAQNINCLSLINLSQSICKNIEDSAEELRNLIPNCKYKNQSLLIFNSWQQGDRKLENIKSLLRDFNFASRIQFMKPFEKLMKTSQKAIFFCSHDCEFNCILRVIDNYLRKIGGCFIFVRKYLSVEKITSSELEDFKKKYLQMFKQQVVYESQANQSQFNIKFSFNSYSQSVFSFIYFDKIRAKKFLKQSYKKKI